MQKEQVRLDKATIERLKRDVSVLDLLGRYGIATEKRGKNHFALCPFHAEDTPSLAVDPVRNTWKCFGCGKGNDGNQGQSPVVGVNVRGTATDGRKVFITGGVVIRYDPACAQ